MNTLLDVLDQPPLAVDDAPSDGFVDCRGVLHTWDEADD